MTVRLADDGSIRLEGICPTEDAEPLLRMLSSNRSAVVDWRACEQAHTAVIQILLAAAPELVGPPADTFLREHLESQLGERGVGADPVSGPTSLPNKQP